MEAAKETFTLQFEHFGGRAEGGAPAVTQQQNFCRGGQSIRGVVRSHNGLHFVFAQPVLQADKKRIAGDAVKRRKRLIEKKQTWSGSKRTGQCDALRLAAGEILWAAGGEIGSSNKVQHLAHAARTRGPIEIPEAVGHVGCGSQVREERGLLRDKRSLALAGRDAKPGGNFSERVAIESNAAAGRMVETRKQTEQRTLARA